MLHFVEYKIYYFCYRGNLNFLYIQNEEEQNFSFLENSYLHIETSKGKKKSTTST